MKRTVLSLLCFLAITMTSCDKQPDKPIITETTEKSRDFSFHTSDDSSGVVTFSNAWSAAKPYNANNLVTYSGTIYLCTVSHAPRATVPSADTGYWVAAGGGVTAATGLTDFANLMIKNAANTATAANTITTTGANVPLTINSDYNQRSLTVNTGGEPFTVSSNGAGCGTFNTNNSRASYGDNVALNQNGVLTFSSGPNYYSTIDTGLARNAAGIIEINNGTKGTLRDLTARTFIGSGSSLTGVALTGSPNVFTAAQTVNALSGNALIVKDSGGINPLFQVDALSNAVNIKGASRNFATVDLVNTGVIRWQPDFGTAPNCGIGRSADNVLEPNNGSTGGACAWKFNTFTVATLPATPAAGTCAMVNDALVPVIGNTVASGGAANALVWYNGANWTVYGK